MKLLTKEILARFASLGSQQENPDPVVVVKFFNPTGAGNWFATEYNPDDKTFFGYVSLFGSSDTDEWGEFSLAELEEFRGRFNLGIERDRHFKECPASVVIAQYTK